MSDDTLPFNHGAEKALLGALLVAADIVLPQMADISPASFHLPGHSDVFEAVRELERQGSKIDPLTVSDYMKRLGNISRLDGREAWLFSCASESPQPSQASHYAEIVRRDAAARSLIKSNGHSTTLATKGKLDDAIETARAGADDAVGVGSIAEPRLIGDVLPGVALDIGSRSARKYGQRITVGIETVDRIVGCLQPGRLIVIAGRPGCGKSAGALGILWHNVKNQIPCLLFSLEMLAEEVTERLIARSTRIGSNDLLRGPKSFQQDEIDRLDFYGLPLRIEDRPLTITQMLAESRRWHARNVARTENKLGIICVDYLQLIRGTTRAESRHLEIGTFTSALKSLAASLRVPVLLLSQLSRDVEKRGGAPMLSDLRDSGSIEADADMVIFPVYEKRPEGQSMDVPLEGTWIIGKNRGGPTGAAGVKWCGPWMEYVANATYSQEF